MSDTQIGKYHVLETLGRGGMGVVVKAKDPSLGRIVAIKMMTAGFTGDPEFLKRFYREAQSTGMLHHANIVTVHELGDQNGVPYLVMEFLEGESLDSIINSRRELTLLDKMSYMVQVCAGLQYAHERHVVHRDIKPANIMVLSGGQIKIVDFGIARMGNDQLTRPGQVMGSIHYMAPEQIREGVVDSRCDIFSTGVALFQLLTYELPFHGRDTASTLLKIVQDPPPPLSKYLHEYPPELNEIMERALAKDPADRYDTAEEFAMDLVQIQSQLKRALVDSCLSTGMEFLENGQLTKSRELLLQALRIDPQHRGANDAMRQVQQRVQQQRRGEQIRQLRAQAEEALEQQQFDRALRCLDQALALHDAEELKARRAEIEQLRVRSDQSREALRRMEAARAVGNLVSALQAAEQVLALDPTHAGAREAQQAIAEEISRRDQQKQVQVFIRDARKHISSRQFTAALEMLRKCEELDPASSNLRELIQLASAGREQEQRRHRIESKAAEIQDALNRDDHAEANHLADEALSEFPGQSLLLKLKELAQGQRSAAERRSWVATQLAAARRSLDSGQVAEALSVLEAAAQKVPTDPAVHSLLVLVRDTAAQQEVEARKADIRKKAKEALRRRAYEDAIQTLKTGKAELATDDFDDLLQFAQAELDSYSRQLKVDEAASQAQSLIDAQEYDEAIEFLERTLAELPDEELRLVLADARRRHEELRQRLTEAADAAHRLIDEEKATQAISLLEAQPTILGDSPEIKRAIENARQKQAWLGEITAEQEKVRQALLQSKLDSAEEILSAAIAKFGPRPEFAPLQDTMVSQRVALNSSVVEKAMREASLLARFGSCSAALERLESVAPYTNGLDPDRKSAFERMLEAVTAEVHAGKVQCGSEQRAGDSPAEADSETFFSPPDQIVFAQARHHTPMVHAAENGTGTQMRVAVPDTVVPQPQPGPQLVSDSTNHEEGSRVMSTRTVLAGPYAKPPADNVIPMPPPLADTDAPDQPGAGDYLLTDLQETTSRNRAWVYAVVVTLLVVAGVGLWLWRANQAAVQRRIRTEQGLEQVMRGSPMASKINVKFGDGVAVLSGQAGDQAAVNALAAKLANVEGVVKIDSRDVQIVRAANPAPLVNPPKPTAAVPPSPPATADSASAAPAIPQPSPQDLRRIQDLFERAQADHDQGQYDGEIQSLDEVLRLAPNNLDPNNRRARSRKRQAIKAKQVDTGAESGEPQ